MAGSPFQGIWRWIVGPHDNQEEEARHLNTNHDKTTPSVTHTTTQVPNPTPSYSNSWKSTSSEILNCSSATTKPTIHSPVVIRPEECVRVADKSHEAAAQKPKILDPSPLLNVPSQRKEATNPVIEKTPAQKLVDEWSSFYSQLSPSLTKSLSSAPSKPLPIFVSMPPPPPASSLSSSPSLTKSPASSSKTMPPVSVAPPISSLSSSPSLNRPLPSSSKTLLRASVPPPLPVSPPQRREATNPVTDNPYVQKFLDELFHSQPSQSLTKSPASSSKTLPRASVPPPPPPPPPVSPLPSSSFGTPPSPHKPHRLSTKSSLSPAPSNPANPKPKSAYILDEKDASPTYFIPEDFKDLIKNDVVPGILKRPLSPSTYKDYFEALLYAEDFYLEKWDDFEMENVTLKLEDASIYKRKGKHNKKIADDEKDDKVFVTFELDSIPERRPFLLSRDFVFVSPSGMRAEPFQGLIYRVVKSNHVLVEFGKDFHAQHYPTCKYNVKFSFNRVCLKRAHQVVASASDAIFRNFLFPDLAPKISILTAQLQFVNSNLDWQQISAVRHILGHQNAVPYLVEGPIAFDNRTNCLSRTGFVVCEAVLQVYRTSPSCRILVCAPTNKGYDVITRSLGGKIQESNIFRANAAFRELDGVPEDILPSCVYERKMECFSCPSIQKLLKYKVISSTFMSSFRLHNEGIMAGHFSHVFLVDASSVIEPEAMVAVANLVNESTVVTVTGAPGNHSGWIRSHIARQNGLLVSYFERLRQRKLYDSLDSDIITVL